MRFEVFKRDHFACQYCGRKPIDGVKLEVDHIYPRSKGGSDEIENLITACFECNRSKSDGLLPVKQLGKITRVIDFKKVRELTSLSRATVWRHERAGSFPSRVKLTPNRTGWFEHEIVAWLNNCRKEHPGKIRGSENSAADQQ